jgi:CubicO group peptidase (beta-lactamase class C family)
MQRLARALSILAVVFWSASAFAQALPTAKPEQVGLSSERLARIGQLVRADVEKGRLPGAVVLVVRKGRVAYFEAIGFRDKASGAPMTKDAIFRIYSMTKGFTSVGVMMLVEEGRSTCPLSASCPWAWSASTPPRASRSSTRCPPTAT